MSLKVPSPSSGNKKSNKSNYLLVVGHEIPSPLEQIICPLVSYLPLPLFITPLGWWLSPLISTIELSALPPVHNPPLAGDCPPCINEWVICPYPLSCTLSPLLVIISPYVNKWRCELAPWAFTARNTAPWLRCEKISGDSGIRVEASTQFIFEAREI